MTPILDVGRDVGRDVGFCPYSFNIPAIKNMICYAFGFSNEKIFKLNA